jgi:lipopolysaccharide export LptBFGC system permease protein LptF
MPSLFRFLIVLVILGILGGAAMIYLAMFVAPHTREMTVRIPSEKLQAQEQQPQAPQAEAQPQSPPAQQ